MAAVLAACTPQPAPTPQVDEWADHGPITFAVANGETVLWQQTVQAWNDAHPGEPVSVVELPDDGGSELAASAAARSGQYSVVSLNVSWTAEFAADGWLVDLPASKFPTADFVASAVTTATYDGKLYAYPQSVDAGLLFARRDLLKRAGVKVPRTSAALAAGCTKLAGVHDGASCKAAAYGDAGALSAAFAEAVWASGGELVNASDEPSVDTSSVATALAALAGTIPAQTPKDALNWSTSYARSEFSAGRAAFLSDWWSSGVLTAAGGSAQVAVTALPGADGAGVAVQGGRNLGITDRSGNKGTAADFVAHLSSRDVQLSLAERGLSSPALSELYTDADLLDRQPSLKTLAQVLPTARLLPQNTHARELTQTVDTAIRPALAGTTTASQALANLQDQLEQLLKK